MNWVVTRLSSYCVVGLGIMVVSHPKKHWLDFLFNKLTLGYQASALYYYIWIVWLPERRGYAIVEQVEEFSDGARATRLTRRYNNSRSGDEVPLLAP